MSVFKNFFDILNHFGGNRSIRTSEKIEEEVQVKGAQSIWKGNLRSLDKALELSIPVQPKTKVVSKDMLD